MKGSGIISGEKYTRDDCVVMLREKQTELNETGLNRFPQRSDFAESEVVAIKAFLGPWPRALEAAGLKEPRAEDRLQKNREKRARAEKRRRQARKAAAKLKTEQESSEI
ncbi:MAG: hypothetical protein ACI4XJ_08445 [Eubacteriales bacterium]